MADIIEMPKLSDTMTAGTLVKWLKREGDAVKTGDILAEVETDKATMELESFFDGTILKVFVPAGSQVPLGEALCAIGKPGEKVESPAAKAPEPARAAAVSAEPPPVPSARAAPRPPPPPAAVAPSGAAPAPAPSAARASVSPLARKLAAERGIDPATLTGSGPGGRVVRADILPGAGPEPAGKPATAAAASARATGPVQEDRLVPVSNMRGAIARRLVESKTQIPHYYLDVEIDAEPLLELRAQLNAALEREGVKLTVNDFILKASAEALRRVPAVNCSWEGAAIRHHPAAHVSFAVAIEDGLITPVIRDAHLKTIFAICSEAKELGRRAKEKKLTPAEYTGGTFCVTNLGMLGIDRFSAIINPPNSAILAVGAAVRKPVVKGDQVAVGQRMTLTLSADHRVVDGAVGATFLAGVRELLEAPALLLL